jgi:hypothetical protein
MRAVYTKYKQALEGSVALRRLTKLISLVVLLFLQITIAGPGGGTSASPRGDPRQY